MAQATNYKQIQKTQIQKWTSKKYGVHVSHVDINKRLKKNKRTQMIPLRTGDEICPSFLPMPE